MAPETLSGLRRYRFGILLAALLGMLVYKPLIELVAPQFPPILTRLTFGSIFGWLTISAVYAVSKRRQTPRVALALGIAVCLVEFADVALVRHETHFLAQTLGILFLGYIVIVMLKFILQQTRVSTDTVFASLCVYLLVGIMWAMVYSLLGQLQPEAFSYTHAEGAAMRFGAEGTSSAVYFSFVTMTTLGYGDIAPVSSAAQSLAILQAIFGQLYLTVLVAWLVGLHIAHSRLESK
jgi:hypothetical protein